MAHAAARTKGTYSEAQFRRLAVRRGRKHGILVVAYSILVIALKKAVCILKDHYRSLSFPEFIVFLCNSLFKNDRILIYCKALQESDITDRKKSVLPIVKGDLAALDCGRKHSERLVWEFQCHLYDGARDFFWYRENGTIGHISWLYYKEVPNRILRLGEKECEIKFCLTLPEFRGKGLYPAALQTIQQYLKEQGYERCFICVKDDNLASIRGIEKSGFQLAGRMRVCKAFGFQISRRRDTRHLIKLGSD